MAETLQRILQGGLTRDEARRERREEAVAGPRPQPFIFNFQPESEAFRLRIQFRKSSVSREELITTLRGILASLEKHDDQDKRGEHGRHDPQDEQGQREEESSGDVDPAVA